MIEVFNLSSIKKFSNLFAGTKCATSSVTVTLFIKRDMSILSLLPRLPAPADLPPPRFPPKAGRRPLNEPRLKLPVRGVVFGRAPKRDGVRVFVYIL